MTTESWIMVGLLILVSGIVVLTGVKKQAGIGILVAVALIGVTAAFGHLEWKDIGFFAPDNWLSTVLWSLGLGIVLAGLANLLIDPASEKMAGEAIALGPIEKVRGNWKRLLVMLFVAWILASFLEEAIFRGFLMSGIGDLIGRRGAQASIGLLISSIIFGLAHWYQGKSGALAAAITGLLLGDIFIWSGYNLWMPILTHAVIDTIGLLMIFFGTDLRLKNLIWKETK